MRRGFVDTPDGQVHYVETGQGPPLLLLHQTPRSVSMWRDVMPLLAPDYRVIALDMLGYGDSDPPPLRGAEADVAAMGRSALHLMDALGIATGHLCGLHTGAYVAAQAAAQAPGRFRTLTLLGYPFMESEAEYADFFRRAAGASAAGPQPAGRRADGAHLTSLWMLAYDQVTKNWLLRGGPTDPDAPTANLRQASPHRPAHQFLSEHDLDVIDRFVADYPKARFTAQTYKVMIAPSADLLRRIPTPTLAIDLETPHESTYCRRAARVAAVMPNCEARQLLGEDENIAEFAPATLVAALRSFLAGRD